MGEQAIRTARSFFPATPHPEPSDAPFTTRLRRRIGYDSMNVVLSGRISPAFIHTMTPLLEAVLTHGHDVTVLGPVDDPAGIARLEAMGVRVVPMRDGSIGSLARAWRTLRSRHTDLLLNCGLSRLFSGSLAGWLAGVNRIYSIIDDAEPLLRRRKGLRKITALFRRLSCRLALSANRSVFLLTAEDRNALTTRRILPKATAYRLLSGMGIDTDAHPRLPLPAQDTPPTVLCVADLARENGLEEFIEAARIIHGDFPEVRFRLLGNPPAHGETISDSDLSLWKSWVEVLPGAPASDLHAELLACHTYVLPACRGGIPHAALAALAAGRPVVTTDAPGCRELVLDGVNGRIVPAGNAAALADALRHCLLDADALPGMAEASRRYAEERFTAAATCRTLCREMHLAHVGPDAALPQTVLGAALKRAFDLVVAVPAALVLLPVLLVLMYKVRKTISRDIFFRQIRPGRGGKLFRILKFKTMTDAAGPDGAPLPDAERMTPLGAKLRSASLDELPELWNVITGEMSLVGPRPLLPQYLDRYSPRQARRHDVRPGITGWAQVNGRNAASWEERLEMDVWYVDNHSLWLDLRILFLTVWKVLRKEDVASPGHVTCPEFMGSGTPAEQDASCTDAAGNGPRNTPEEHGQ